MANLFYETNINKQYGMDDESFHVKRLKANLDQISKKIDSSGSVKSFDKKTSPDSEVNENESVNAVSFGNNITIIQAENAFYENKIKGLEMILKRMNDDYSKKISRQSEIKSLDTALIEIQRRIGSLQNGLARLDVSDFKSLRRVSFVFSPIEYVAGASVFVFSIFAATLSLLMGMVLSLSRELRNPSLTSIGSFEEIGLRVLGALPSHKNPLLNELDEKLHFHFAKSAINLENTLSFVKSKIVLFTPIEDSMQSATIAFNLGCYFSNTGSKVLIIETDLINNCLVRLTGAPLQGGISELAFHQGEVSISPFQIQKGLDLLTGDPKLMPKDYRLSSQDFFDLLSELKGQYDFIFIHAKSCLEGPDAADLSRYAGISLVTCDSKTITIDLLEKFVAEMKLFLSRESMFVLEDPEDLLVSHSEHEKKQSRNVKDLRKNTNTDNSSKAA